MLGPPTPLSSQVKLTTVATAVIVSSPMVYSSSTGCSLKKNVRGPWTLAHEGREVAMTPHHLRPPSLRSQASPAPLPPLSCQIPSPHNQARPPPPLICQI